ncbi:MAG: glycosyltransferase family 4 protein [Granulosicoccus sp.]
MDIRESHPEPRLGIIISMFPELHETFILRELTALESMGVRFDIFSTQFPRDPITLDDAIRLSGERTTYSRLFTLATLSAFAKMSFRQPLALIRCVWHVLRYGLDRPRDIVKNLAILPLALYIGEWGRSRGVTHWHGHWANVPTSACWYLGRLYGQSWSAAIHGEDIFSANRFLRHKLDDALFIVVCSAYFCNYLKTQMQIENPEKIHLNYHGLDARVARHAEWAGSATSRSLRHPRTVSLVSIGRLVSTKGHDVLLRACGRLKRTGLHFHLQLIGSGPLRTTLESLAVAEGIAEMVSFSGALAFEDVLATLRDADMFVLAPRLVHGQPPDGIPNVIAEAMALGIPVVSTRVSAIPELVQDGVTGCLVEADDDAALAQAIQRLAEDENLRHNLRVAARKRVKVLFDQNVNIRELLDLFEYYVPSGFVSQGGD